MWLMIAVVNDCLG